MASLEQIDANRANATHSTGPVTDAGKQISSRNAVTHGLTSKALIMPGENIEEFEALRSDTLATLAPANEYERTLATNVATALWRYNRVQRFETAYWELQFRMASEAVTAPARDADADPDTEIEPPDDLDPNMVAASTFVDPVQSRTVALLHRYLTAAERACHRTTKAWENARKNRQSSTASDSLPSMTAALPCGTRRFASPSSESASAALAVGTTELTTRSLGQFAGPSPESATTAGQLPRNSSPDPEPPPPFPMVLDDNSLATMTTDEFNALLQHIRTPGTPPLLVREPEESLAIDRESTIGFVSQNPRAERRAEERARRKAEKKLLRQHPAAA